MPQRVVDLLEGESLLNDATGLLALQFGVEMVVQGTTPTVTRGLLEFAWLTIGGVLVGLAIGWAVTWLERWVDDGPVENRPIADCALRSIPGGRCGESLWRHCGRGLRAAGELAEFDLFFRPGYGYRRWRFGMRWSFC